MRKTELNLLNGTLFAVVGLGLALYFLEAILSCIGLIWAVIENPKGALPFLAMGGGIVGGIWLLCHLLGWIEARIARRNRPW